MWRSISVAEAMTINLPDVGAVLLERSFRAKHINITVKPYIGVRVAVPSGVSFKKAIDVVKSKAAWIKQHQEKMKVFEKQRKEMGEITNVNEAKENIRARLMELSEKHKYKYNKVFIREQKTRWGSCSVKNNINLNIKLVLLPSRLMDYVILHELVHTKHKNHSPLFWTELDNLTGSAKVLNKQLKSYGIGLL